MLSFHRLISIPWKRSGSSATLYCNYLVFFSCEVECIALSKGVVSSSISLCVRADEFQCLPGSDYSTRTNGVSRHFVSLKSQLIHLEDAEANITLMAHSYDDISAECFLVSWLVSVGVNVGYHPVLHVMRA